MKNKSCLDYSWQRKLFSGIVEHKSILSFALRWAVQRCNGPRISNNQVQIISFVAASFGQIQPNLTVYGLQTENLNFATMKRLKWTVDQALGPMGASNNQIFHTIAVNIKAENNELNEITRASIVKAIYSLVK